ncbi:unnamed protein product [Notodromas monacha]|uniref:Uncharacterized protein n=1 Tax=Notodromas monacha TaxID=399045 RepID=A0A7R9GLJ5_9CRUS|nr:unnamed protein product [Notodromas monacha]CAG0925021.1 unnamed protein product [Notodromas monacha]
MQRSPPASGIPGFYPPGYDYSNGKYESCDNGTDGEGSLLSSSPPASNHGMMAASPESVAHFEPEQQPVKPQQHHQFQDSVGNSRHGHRQHFSSPGIVSPPPQPPLSHPPLPSAPPPQPSHHLHHLHHHHLHHHHGHHHHHHHHPQPHYSADVPPPDGRTRNSPKDRRLEVNGNKTPINRPKQFDACGDEPSLYRKDGVFLTGAEKKKRATSSHDKRR